MHDILLLLPDHPTVWWFNGAIVFVYATFLEFVWDQALGGHPPLSIDTHRGGYNMHVWQTTCLSDAVTLEQHRVAAYLRILSLLPGTFLSVQPCRFCSITEGNQFAHVLD